MIINQPGVYDLPPADYHADPVPGGSLSSTGARLILAECPAVFRYRQLNPKTTKEMDFGSVAHRIVLGKGDDYRVMDHPDRRTNAYKADHAAAVEAGCVPILKKDFEIVLAMAAAVRQNKLIGRLMDTGTPEQCLFVKSGGIWRRAMIDWVNGKGPVDYKTTTKLTSDAIARTIWTYRYDLQAAWYLEMCRALGLPCDTFRFVFQLKEPPYLTRVVELTPSDLAAAHDTNEGLAKIYRDCSALDEWPGYGEDVATIALPGWANRYDTEAAV